MPSAHRNKYGIASSDKGKIELPRDPALQPPIQYPSQAGWFKLGAEDTLNTPEKFVAFVNEYAPPRGMNFLGFRYRRGDQAGRDLVHSYIRNTTSPEVKEFYQRIVDMKDIPPAHDAAVVLTWTMQSLNALPNIEVKSDQDPTKSMTIKKGYEKVLKQLYVSGPLIETALSDCTDQDTINKLGELFYEAKNLWFLSAISGKDLFASL